jgi:hypothetical protein
MSLEVQNTPSATEMSSPVPADDLAHQIASADLIVVATVTKIGDTREPVSLVSPEARPDDDLLRMAELAVVRTLAGGHDSDTVRVFFLVGKAPSRPWIELTQGQTVLLFLRSAAGAYVPVAAAGNPIQTLPSTASPPVGASRTQAVAHELEQIILTAAPGAALSLLVQATRARAGLQGDVDLHLLGTPALQYGVRRTAWVSIALAEGKIEVLSEVAPLFAAPVTDAPEALRSLLIQKLSEIRTPAARQQLAALCQNARVDLARAAASALRQLHHPATIPDLIELLNNADLEVRYQAVMGLAELEPGVEAGPSFEVYHSDESRYLQRWKQWWESSGRSWMNKS